MPEDYGGKNGYYNMNKNIAAVKNKPNFLSKYGNYGIGMTKLKFMPLQNETWKDFEDLFGERGACGGCWCMSWRLKKSEFDKSKGDGNKNLMKKLVKNNEVIGILAYMDDKPIGWCSVAPREKFIRLNNSKVLGRIDANPVWSIVCFFINKNYRKIGVSAEYLKELLISVNQKGHLFLKDIRLNLILKICRLHLHGLDFRMHI